MVNLADVSRLVRFLAGVLEALDLAEGALDQAGAALAMRQLDDEAAGVYDEVRIALLRIRELRRGE